MTDRNTQQYTNSNYAKEIMEKTLTLKILSQNFIKLYYDRDVTVIKLDRQHRYSNR